MLKKLRDTPSHPGTCPYTVVDHRKATNPYLDKYGPENWKKEISSCVFMKKFMCVTELVKKFTIVAKRHLKEQVMKMTGIFTMMR